MKTLLLTLLLTLNLSASYAQKNVVSSNVASKFIQYYNLEKPDSMYTLFADDAKQQVSIAVLAAIIKQDKPVMGNLLKGEYWMGDETTDCYVATCERSAQVFYIILNKNNKIVGFNADDDRRELPGTITAKTSTSTLKGTLSIPETAPPVPVVLLIAGSGPTDRNGNNKLIAGKPDYFLMMSDALQLKNIAVLRYDKRAVGQSTSTKAPTDVVFTDMVDDAVAYIKLLKADKRFSKVIVAGHSEGSLIGMLACQREKVDAFISLSGSGFPLDVTLKTQFKKTFTPAENETANLILDSLKARPSIHLQLSPAMAAFFGSAQGYWHSWMQYNPQQEIARLIIPVLIVQGTTDIQISVADAQQLKKAKPDAQLKLIPGMGHILKPAPADRQQNMATYTQPGLALHPDLIPLLTQFIATLK